MLSFKYFVENLNLGIIFNFICSGTLCKNGFIASNVFSVN